MKQLSTIAAVIAGAGVVLGAFGAHALTDRLAELGTTATWETAVDYQMWHALAILALAITGDGRLRAAACLAFLAGILLFSGSLYGLALDGPRWLGPVTPLGGLSLITGWALAAAGLACRSSVRAQAD